MASKQAVPDPYPGKGPIPVGVAGFYKRAEALITIQNFLQAGDSVSLVGERKAGKTSFLQYLTVNLSSNEYIPIFVDTQKIMPRTDQTFLGSLVESAAKAIAKAKNIESQLINLNEDVVIEGSLQEFLKKLHKTLDYHFGEEDLRTMCFYLGVDYDNLPAQGKANKARELILHFQRRERLSFLIRLGREMRPTIQWEDTPIEFQRATKIDGMKIATFEVEPKEAYKAFQKDLDLLREQLTVDSTGKRFKVVWLIDEVETLQDYAESELFVFLRPFAQFDPDFRMVTAGYDVLYTLSSLSKWSPFYNAFRHIPLKGLNPVVAQQLIDDALEIMEATIDPNLYTDMLQWTGQKPFFLKWVLSEISAALNQQPGNYHIDQDVWNAAKELFLREQDIRFVFNHLWQTHTTKRQQVVLSLMASLSELSTHPQILEKLRMQRLLEGSPRAAQDLVDDLTRLEQLGFLYEQIGTYIFTSGCLQMWIAKYKPL